MLVELSVMELRYDAVMEIVSGEPRSEVAWDVRRMIINVRLQSLAAPML
jgi:hypothetical protein